MAMNHRSQVWIRSLRKPDRLEAILPRHPRAKYFYPNRIKDKKERKEFDAWHKTNRKKPFDVKQMAKDYGHQDVLILAKACLRFRKEILDITDMQMDPFMNSFTLAGMCGSIFRLKFLKEDTIALVPTTTYEELGKKNSVLGNCFLAWLARKERRDIRSATPSSINVLNVDPTQPKKPFLGEYVVPGVGSVDGFRPETKEVIEVLGK